MQKKLLVKFNIYVNKTGIGGTYLNVLKAIYDKPFPSGSVGKESACNVGDPRSIPGSGRSPGEGNGNLLQYCCLENSMDRGPGGLQSMGSQSWTQLCD